jgi:hypothetical protein
LLLTSWKDRTLFSVSQTGMVNNLNDGMMWGLLVWGQSFSWWLTAVALLGLGTGMVYPTLPAAWKCLKFRQSSRRIRARSWWFRRTPTLAIRRPYPQDTAVSVL